MAIKVARVFSDVANSLDDLEHFKFSIIANEDGAEFVFPPGNEIVGLDDSYIEDNRVRLEAQGAEPESPEDWIEVAGYGIRALFLDPEVEYNSMKKARAGEDDFAEEAAGFISDDKNLDNEEDDLDVEDVYEAESAGFESIDNLFSYYILASDEGDVVALFRVKDGEEELRTSYGWGGQSADQDEEWDGYLQFIMDKEILPIYDRMVSENKNITLDDVKEFTRKES